MEDIVLKFKPPGQRPVTASLRPDGKWSATLRFWEEYLNLRFDPETIPPSPAAGSNQFAGQARAAADDLKGELTFPPEKPEDNVEGRVY